MRELLARASASRPLWIGVLDVVTGLLLIQFLLDGRHQVALRVVVVVGWVILVSAVTLPQISHSRRARRAAAESAEPAQISGASRQS